MINRGFADLEDLKDIECFVFDMDGTLYLGNNVLSGAIELIRKLEEKQIKYFYFTNNSSRSIKEYVKRLETLGFPNVCEDKILTSGQVTIHYIRTHYDDAEIFLLGTEALREQFIESGIKLVPMEAEKCDAVVFGFDTTMDYAKANNACRFIAEGADFLATNVDRVCPLEGGKFMLDCGSMCRMIEHATGKEAKFLGKPYAETVDFILDFAKTEKKKTAMVGDRFYTDVMTAINGGIVAVAVLSGEATLEELLEHKDEIDYIIDGVNVIYDVIK